MENCKPIVGVRGMNRGGKVYQVIWHSLGFNKKKKGKERKKALYLSVKIVGTKMSFDKDHLGKICRHRRWKKHLLMCKITKFDSDFVKN